MKTLRDYQLLSLDILSKGMSGLDASDMGTGKTLVAVERVRRMELNGPPRVLVVAPINTHHGWVATFSEQFPSLQKHGLIRVCGTFKKDPDGWAEMLAHKPGVFIVGWEAMRGWIKWEKDEDGRKTGRILEDHTPPWAKTGTWDIVIADECHRAANRRSQAHRVLMSIKTRYKLAMSGTPAGNKPEGLWATLHWLWLDKFRHFWPWANAVLRVVPCPFAGRKILGEKRPGAIWDSIPVVVRHRLEDVVKQLPDVITHTVMVEMSPAQKRIYRKFEEEALAWLDAHAIATPLPIHQRIRLRQVALAKPSAVLDNDGNPEVYFEGNVKSPKIDALLDIMEDIPEYEPVLVLTDSRKLIASVVHHIDRKYGANTAIEWSSALPKSKRQPVIDGFGKPGHPRVIVAVIAAIGEGTDGLQIRCAHEIWLSQSENNIHNQQAKRRLARSGQTRPVNRWHIHSKNTIDVQVYERMEDNTKVMARVYKDE